MMAITVSPLEKLPLDVRDRLLTSLPNFASLRTAVLSCKALHEAYAMRKHSIFNSVVRNEVGPALEEALVVSRATRDVDENHKEDEVNDRMADRDGWYWDSKVDVEDAYVLGEVARVASGLEDEFSLRYKDRTRQTSALTYTESLAFRRALYYNWILSILSRAEYDDEEDFEAMDDDGINTNTETSDSFVRVLSDLDDKSLVAVYQIDVFLDDVYERTHHPHQTDNSWQTRLMRRSPRFPPSDLLDSFKRQMFESEFDYAPASEAVTLGFDNLLRKRDVLKLFEEKLKKQAILEGVSEGYTAECQKCHKATGWLYNDSCWPRLSEERPVRLPMLVRLLPGRLPNNISARVLLDHYINAPDFHHHFMEDLLASQNDPAANWQKGEWVCGDCVVRFVKQELLSWLVRRLAQDGHVFKTNCWYGYNCRTQTHKQEHAEKLNHLCEPDPERECAI